MCYATKYFELEYLILKQKQWKGTITSTVLVIGSTDFIDDVAATELL